MAQNALLNTGTNLETYTINNHKSNISENELAGDIRGHQRSAEAHTNHGQDSDRDHFKVPYDCRFSYITLNDYWATSKRGNRDEKIPGKGHAQIRF